MDAAQQETLQAVAAARRAAATGQYLNALPLVVVCIQKLKVLLDLLHCALLLVILTF